MVVVVAAVEAATVAGAGASYPTLAQIPGFRPNFGSNPCTLLRTHRGWAKSGATRARTLLLFQWFIPIVSSRFLGSMPRWRRKRRSRPHPKHQLSAKPSALEGGLGFGCGLGCLGLESSGLVSVSGSCWLVRGSRKACSGQKISGVKNLCGF